MARLLDVRQCVCAGLFLLWLCPGCSGGAGAPKTVKVEGRVTYQNKPVTRGTVLFQPEGAAAGEAVHPATGQISADGTFRMSSFANGDGVVPGRYKVGVRSFVSGPTPDNPSAPFVWAVPEKYVNPATSGLSASISADGPARQEFNLELN